MSDGQQQEYDAIIIGAGSVGEPLARELAGAGKRTALIEKADLGGTCANRGCTPTKAYEASARIAHMARVGTRWGVHADNVRVELAGVRARKDGVIAASRRASAASLDAVPGLDLLYGEARFADGGPRRVAVRPRDGAETVLSARETVVICTGTRPTVPPLDGLDRVPYHTSDTVYETDDLPDRLIVLGGNYIGVEAAQIFRRFGCAVTLVEALPHLLPQEDEDTAGAVQAMLQAEGITVRAGVKAHAVEADGDGGITLRMEEGEAVRGTHLLVATGRSPNTAGLNLDAAGVKTDDRGYVRADDRLRTTAEGVYAGGDVAFSPQFTHIAYDDFRVLRSQILGDGSRTRAGRNVPYIVYTDPPLGHVGLSEREARRQGVPYRLVRLPMSEVAYAVDVGETEGFIKVLLDPATNRLLGVTVFGLHAEEVMSTLQVALMGGLTATDLRDAIFAYPTVADSFSKLFAPDTVT
jgi:pyruvate/2-oxoglutarate dehydrogenase complex dihydrolipoamide dehydrogenase (E3) component